MKHEKLILCITIVTSIVVLVVPLAVMVTTTGVGSYEVKLPSTYDKNYTEDVDGFALLEEQQFIDWDTYEAEPELCVQLSTTSVASSYSVQSSRPHITNRSASDDHIILMADSDAWELITNGKFESYPTGTYASYASILEELKLQNTETITVNVWYWADPDNATNMEKVTATKTFAVNSSIADLFAHAFADIYADPSQPVLNLGDAGMGTWVLRGKNHKTSGGVSAHALGVAIDINPSTGSFKVNDTWYGNGYGQKVMTREMWEQMPECHTKYHILYDGCPIVEIFKSYGFVWGGDWSSTKDPMHFSFIGDGKDARERGISNYWKAGGM